MPRTQRTIVAVALASVAASALIAAAAPAGSLEAGEQALGTGGDPVTEWNENAGEATVAACFFGGTRRSRRACTRWCISQSMTR